MRAPHVTRSGRLTSLSTGYLDEAAATYQLYSNSSPAKRKCPPIARGRLQSYLRLIFAPLGALATMESGARSALASNGPGGYSGHRLGPAPIEPSAALAIP